MTYLYWLIILSSTINFLFCIIVGGILIKILSRSIKVPSLSSYPFYLFRVIETISDAVVSCNVNGRIVSWNKGAEALFGYSFEEVYGQDLSRYIPITIDNKLKYKTYEIEYHHKLGKFINLLVTTSQLVDESNHIIGFGIILTDITEKKILEQSLQSKVSDLATLNNYLLLQWKNLSKANKELECVNNELNSFAYIVSHDLKEPLRAIALSADCLLEEIGKTVAPSQLKLLQLLRERALVMQKLLDDLLLYAKIGSALNHPEIVDTYKLVSDIVQLLPIPKEFSVCIDQTLPTLTTYRIPLQQIFHNLISNAINHHHPEGGWIQITAKDHLHYTEFSVADNGPGIPKKDHQKIFNMFCTLKLREGKYGSGIGLAIVKQLIDRMDGQMILDSKPGKGSTFTFKWPKDLSHRNGGSSKPLSLRECS